MILLSYRVFLFFHSFFLFHLFFRSIALIDQPFLLPSFTLDDALLLVFSWVVFLVVVALPNAISRRASIGKHRSSIPKSSKKKRKEKKKFSVNLRFYRIWWKSIRIAFIRNNFHHFISLLIFVYDLSFARRFLFFFLFFSVFNLRLMKDLF